MGLDATLVGWLDGRRVFHEGQPYTPPAGATPRIEAEVAVRMAADLPGGASCDEARAAIDSVAPAIEFVNGAKPLVPLDELLAHDILHDAVLFGIDAPLGAALGLVAGGYPAVRQNGELVRAGIAGRYPDDMAEIVAHTADVLARHGEALQAGDRIICGSYIDPFGISKGDLVDADFGPLGKITFNVG
jgi:2-oxo-hept-3-ene-1,7-dioate hydratase